MKVRQRNTIWLKHERERFYLSKKKLGEINTKKMKKVKIIIVHFQKPNEKVFVGF
jgi:hypothetical protein